MMTGFLMLAFVFLVAGVISVPIASRLGLGSVLGYLIAGILISPVLALLNVDVIAIQHFAEFGVVMMLFLDRSWRRASRADHTGRNGRGVGFRIGLDRRAGDWSGHGTVVHRHRFTDPERKGPDEK
jgi:hypothetical protein